MSSLSRCPARRIRDADRVTSARFVPPAPAQAPAPPSDVVGRRSRRSELPDLGILRPFLLDERVTDVFLNGDGRVWVDRGVDLAPEPPGPGAGDGGTKRAEVTPSAWRRGERDEAQRSRPC